ncbi:carbohydrate ABC transporter permease [Actinacidiphila alni]|uniref:carbohydrate ABC transporter permease n=1 Tax=Actinacidiphila alni TaxID=380248 RepID=UPI0034516DDA
MTLEGIRRHRIPRGGSVATTLLRTAVWAAVAFNLFLLAWVVLTSFKTTREVFDHPWAFPHHLSFGNFGTAWNVGGFGPAAVHSVLVSFATAFASVFIAAPAAYAISRPGSRAGRTLSLFFALGIGVPVQVIVLPIFLMLARANLTDSLTGLTLAYVGMAMPFTVFLLTAFFSSLPTELEEAAALDGAGPLRTYWQIMLPVARPGLVTAFILQLIGAWNETMLALVALVDPGKQTLPLALVGFIQQQQHNGTNWGGMFAGICVVVLPMVALFALVGRRITEGLTVGMGK